MGSDIHNISVLTANLFLSCSDSHSKSCQRAIKWNGLFPAFLVYTPKWAGHDTVPLAVVCGVACCQGTKAPAWQGHVTEQQEHLYRTGKTFKIVQVKKKKGCAQSEAPKIAVSLQRKNTAAYCAQCWSKSYQLMSSWSFLPGKFRWMPPSVLSLKSLTVHFRISVYQHLQKRPCVITKRLSASCTI